MTEFYVSEDDDQESAVVLNFAYARGYLDIAERANAEGNFQLRDAACRMVAVALGLSL